MLGIVLVLCPTQQNCRLLELLILQVRRRLISIAKRRRDGWRLHDRGHSCTLNYGGKLRIVDRGRLELQVCEDREEVDDEEGSKGAHDAGDLGHVRIDDGQDEGWDQDREVHQDVHFLARSVLLACGEQKDLRTLERDDQSVNGEKLGKCTKADEGCEHVFCVEHVERVLRNLALQLFIMDDLV